MPSSDTDKYLAIHLNDHLGASTALIELARRTLGESEGTELYGFLRGLVEQLGEDHQELVRFIDQVGADPDRLKVAGGWVSEKVGRLKLNGELLGTSPLSRVVELEGLSLGIEAKRLLWIALREAQGERFGVERLEELIARAERQRAQVEEHRRVAARDALAPSGG